MMPRATVNGEGLSFVNALFISTSAVCVTGLIVVDTATHFTTLGQSIILVLICMELLKADVSRIIARAGSDTQEAILNRIGSSEVIHPEKDESERIAAQLIHFSGSDYFELSKDIAIYEIEAPEDMQGYTLQDLKIRQRYSVNLLTIKRPKTSELEMGGEPTEEVEILGVLEPSTKIRSNDRLMMGRHEDINKLIDTN